MKDKRLYKGYRIANNPNPNETFTLVDSVNFKKPCVISLENLAGFLTVKVDDNLNNLNVVSVNCENQEDNPENPPNTFKVNTKAHIAIDDNYLYIWIPLLKRWKRAILSNWK